MHRAEFAQEITQRGGHASLSSIPSHPIRKP
jgi:hypothetical protein